MTEWNNELTTEFLEAYPSERVIWDPAHLKHKDKKLLNDAWLRLSARFHISVSDLKMKKDSLMAAFRGHLRKKKFSIRSGTGAEEVYKPIWFAYELMEQFLALIHYCTPTLNTESQAESSEGGTSKDEIPKESVEMSEALGNSQISQSPAQPSTVPPESSHRRKNPTELAEAGAQMKDAFNMLRNVMHKKMQEKEEDDCDLFGRMLAKKLRKFPENELELIMHEIDGVVISRRLLLSSEQELN